MGKTTTNQAWNPDAFAVTSLDGVLPRKKVTAVEAHGADRIRKRETCLTL